MTDYVIDTRHLSKRFGAKLALNDFSLQVAKGGVHALIGSNGAGKSTLFRVLLGFISPSSGSSTLLGEDCTMLSPATRGKVGYVNEEHTLPGWIKVKALKTMQQSYYPQWKEEIYRNVIANFDVREEQPVNSLSRGERAGFNLAMALAQSPELLILDEPTLGLDVVAKQEFLEALLFSSTLDMTVIYCSHLMEEVEKLADDLIILENGKLKNQSSPEAFSARITLWITEARFQPLVREKVPSLLSSRTIEDELHFYVLDQPESFASQLALMGIKNATPAPVGLDTAVRVYMTKNHLGMQ